MQHQLGITFVQILPRALSHPHQQLDDGNAERQQENQSAKSRRQPAARTGQPGAMQQCLAPGRLVIAGIATRLALQKQPRQHNHQQQRRQLRRRLHIEKSVPRLVDRRGERVVIEDGHGAEIRQGFHQRQRHAGRNRRTRHRQRHQKKSAQRTVTQHPRCFQRLAPLC